MKKATETDRGELVKRIRVLEAEGKTYQQVADALNVEGLGNSKGEPWKSDSIRVALARDAKRKAKVGTYPVPQGSLEDTTPYTGTTPEPQEKQGESSHKDTAIAPQPEIEYDNTTDESQSERGTTEPHVVAQTGLDPETIATLKEVAAWWQSRKEEGVVAPDVPEGYRPEFKGKRKNTSVRVNAVLLKDAADEAGIGVSPLLERLLWAYLGNDQKYLK